MDSGSSLSIRTRVLTVAVFLAGVVVAFYLYTHTATAPVASVESTVATTTTEQVSTSTLSEAVAREESNTIPMALDVKPWKWVSATYPDGAVLTPKTADAFSITFNANGAFSAETDCNSVTGSYEARVGTLSLGSIASTKMFCEGSQEAEFGALLSAVETYRFTNKAHLIMNTSDGTEIVFR